jgi:hypothetical protein
MALLWAHLVSKHWSVVIRVTLDGVMLVIAIGSLAVYGVVAVSPPGTHTAFAFVVVPPASFLLSATGVSMAALTSGRLSDGQPSLVEGARSTLAPARVTD